MFNKIRQHFSSFLCTALFSIALLVPAQIESMKRAADSLDFNASSVATGNNADAWTMYFNQLSSLINFNLMHNANVNSSQNYKVDLVTLKALPKEIQSNIAFNAIVEFLITPKTLAQKNEIQESYLTAHNNKIANIIEGNVKIWDINTGELWDKIKLDTPIVDEFVKIYNNKMIITGMPLIGQYNNLYIVDITANTYKSWHEPDYDRVVEIDDEKIVIPFRKEDGLLYIKAYDHTGNLLNNCPCEKISFSSWHDITAFRSHIKINKNKLICRYDKSTVKIYDINTGNTLSTLKKSSPFGGSIFTSIATNNNTMILGSSLGANNIAEIYDIETGNLLHTLRGHTDTICSISIDGNKVATASADMTIKIWDINSGTLLQTFAGLIESRDFMRNCIKVGDKIIAKSHDALKMWPLYFDLNTPEFTSDDTPEAWIKANLTILQAELINRAQRKIADYQSLIIALPDEFNKIGMNESQEQYDGRTYFSLHENVRKHLRTRLSIQAAKKVEQLQQPEDCDVD